MSMTNEIAYDVLKSLCEKDNDFCERCTIYEEIGCSNCGDEAVRLALESLQKQISKKVVKDEYCGFVTYECPVCHHTINLTDEHQYCNKCGQKLKIKG